jgi:hypothetical protein
MKVKRRMELDCCQMDKTDPAGSRGSWRGIAGHGRLSACSSPFDQGVSGQEDDRQSDPALSQRAEQAPA